MSRLKLKLFHISQDDLNGKLVMPRVPYNFFTKKGYENCSIARISFAPSIENCFFAIGGNIQGKKFNVYEPIDYNMLKIMTNEEIVRNNYIPDAVYSKEIWSLSPVRMKFLYRVCATTAIDTPVIINYGNEIAEGYFWNWEFVEE